MDSETLIKSLGLFSEAGWPQKLSAKAVQMALQAGTPGQFRKLPSYIPAKSESPWRPELLLIDVGGTATKVARRKIEKSGADPVWQVLFEDPNEAFDDRSLPGSSLERFVAAVARRVRRALIPQGSYSLGLVWSNGMKSIPIPGRGISGQVVNRDRYTKGEWFVADAKDGDDLGRLFDQAFRDVGFEIDQILAANDTTLTMKGIECADAGMIVSTGLNATIVEDSPQGELICNAEMGGSFDFPKEWLGAGDLLEPNEPCRIIEHLVAGKFLPMIFAGHILAGPARAELSKIVGFLQSQSNSGFEYFNAADLSHLIEGIEQFLIARPELRAVGADELAILKSLAGVLFERSARFAAVLALASIVRQFNQKDHFLIALDSRLARESKFFWGVLQEQLGLLMPKGKTATLRLVDRIAVPGGVLSVPMLGAAHALDCLN